MMQNNYVRKIRQKNNHVKQESQNRGRIKQLDIAAIICTGGRMYRVNADDLHLPRLLIVESGRPACAAADAAPMRKLCPLNDETSRPAEESAVRTAVTKVSSDRGAPELSKNNGPGVDGRIAK